MPLILEVTWCRFQSKHYAAGYFIDRFGSECKAAFRLCNLKVFFIFGTTPKSELETEQGCKSRLGANVAFKNTWINKPNQTTGGRRKQREKIVCEAETQPVVFSL